MIGNPLLLSDEGYQISRSVRLRSSASAYFNRTPASATNRRTWTWSGWVKRGALGVNGRLLGVYGTTDSTYIEFGFSSSDTLAFGYFSGNWRITSQVFRDPSAWYHIVLAFDTTQATAANRIKLYVNGVEVTAFSTNNNPSQNSDWAVNNNQAHHLFQNGNSGNYFDGYATEINFIDGQALTPSSFGQINSYTGVWSPLKYTGTYGTNGFYLNFSDNSSNTATTIGKDYSGNGNNWTPNNISVTSGTTYDSMVDVPTLWADGGNGRGNYAVLNPLDKGAATTLTAANLNNDYSGTATDSMSFSSIAFDVASSQFFAEFTYVSSSLIGSGIPGIGVADVSTVGTGNISTTGTAVIYLDDGTKTVNGTNSSYGATWTTGDVVGVYVNSGTIVFYKNGVSQGNAATGLTGTYKFVVRGRSGTSRTFTIAANFGQRPFAYTPPTGFQSLNTLNLSTPTIVNGAGYMAATLYTGTGSSQTISNAVNNVSFQPDLVWIKSRSAATDHKLTDAVRGTTKALSSNTTGAETTDTNGLTAFGSTGFTVGSDTNYNNNTATYVAWQWKANGAGVTNTNGSITSTVSASTTAGFSVVTYTGTGANATVGHGLGVAPSMVIVKSRSNTSDWVAYHVGLPSAAYRIYLNYNLAQDSGAAAAATWNSTAPSSSVFSVGTNINSNSSGWTFVAYCFAQVAGFSRFGSYTGNGSADGPFVYLGFRPAFIMVKRTDTTGNWTIHDDRRLGYNGASASKELYPNLSNAEGSDSMDQLSNGFKLRDTYADVNASGGTYIYAAFAENPFKYSLAQ